MRLRDLLVLPLYIVGSMFVLPLLGFAIFGVPRLNEVKQQVVLQQSVYKKLLQIKDLRVEVSQNLLWLEFRGGRYFYEQIKRLSDREAEGLEELVKIESDKPQLNMLIREYVDLEKKLLGARLDLAQSIASGERSKRWSLFNTGRLLNTFVDARGVDVLEYVDQEIRSLSGQLQNIYKTLNNISAVVIAVVLLVVLLQYLVVNKWIIKPLESILFAVRRVTLGDFSPMKKGPVASQELQELTVSVARMTNSLRENKEQQDLFTAVAAHDLREPLGAIVSYADLIELEKDSFSYEDAREALPRIRRNAVAGLDMVTNLLELARSSAQGLKLESIDLNSLFLEVVLELEYQIKAVDSTIDASELGEVVGDVTQLRSLFRNFITNALKYREPSRRLVLSIYRTDPDSGHLELHFKDNGIGFQQEEFENFLQPFTGAGVKRFKNRSFGLGLAVCKRVVQNHKGKITAKSKLGEGTDFAVRLPKQSL